MRNLAFAGKRTKLPRKRTGEEDAVACDLGGGKKRKRYKNHGVREGG